MQELQQKKVWKMIRYSKLAILIYVLIIIYLVFEMLKFYDKWAYLDAKIQTNDHNLAQVEDALEKKKNELAFLETERGREDFYRRTMPVAAEGEKVIILYNATSSPVQAVPTNTSFWKELKSKWEYFIKTYTNL